MLEEFGHFHPHLLELIKCAISFAISVRVVL